MRAAAKSPATTTPTMLIRLMAHIIPRPIMSCIIAASGHSAARGKYCSERNLVERRCNAFRQPPSLNQPIDGGDHHQGSAGRDHTTDHWHSDALHHFRAGAAVLEDRDQTRHDGNCGDGIASSATAAPLPRPNRPQHPPSAVAAEVRDAQWLDIKSPCGLEWCLEDIQDCRSYKGCMGHQDRMAALGQKLRH